jgi:hypothetical protein
MMAITTAKWGLVLAMILLGTGCASVPGPGITCREVQHGAAGYQAGMDELARLAKLPSGAWNRYHELAVSDLCRSEPTGIDQLTGDGLLDIGEAVRIAAVLHKPYMPRIRSSSEVTFGEVRQQLLRIGACNSCADNIARYYTERPASQCAILAKKALAGDPDGVAKLLADPAYCIWRY